MLTFRMRFAVYALIAFVASAAQFNLFDCNGVRPLSFVACALAILIALVVIDRISAVSVSGRSLRARLAVGTAVVVGGGALIWALAWLTMISHMCG